MRFVPVILVVLILSGCTSSRTLAPASSSGAEVNRALAGKTVEITLVGGQTHSGTSVVVLADSTSWIGSDTQEFHRVPTYEVATITRRSRGRGFVQGALISGLASAVAVGTLAVLDTDDWGRYNDAKPAFGMAVGTLAFIPGAIPGGIAGYSRGAERRYDVVLPAPDLSAQSAPDSISMGAVRSTGE